VIRPATPKDLTDMAALEAAEPMGTQWSAKQLGESLQKQDAIILAIEVEGQLAGHAVAWWIAGELEVMTLAISPVFRRRGLGQRLLQALLNARSHQSAFLELRESNLAALKLYQQAGFETVGRRKRYYRDGEDALIMRRKNSPKA